MTSADAVPTRLAKITSADGMHSWAVLDDSDGIGLLPPGTTLGSLLALDAAALARTLAAAQREPSGELKLLAPVDDDTEVWAAGVTYEVSRHARMAESAAADVYDRVYAANRPELFFKAVGWRVVGPGASVGVREDSTWDVPEPELGIVCDSAGRIAGYTVVNDVSSRNIEGENPLYLPQAKIYYRACAVGPWIRLAHVVSDPYRLRIAARILRGGQLLWAGQTDTSRLHRKLADLVSWLYRGDVFPRGVILATGTSAVPGDDVTLQSGDDVIIDIEGIGSLVNPVKRGIVSEECLYSRNGGG